VRTFSFKRFAALLRKEWLQILRDPITLRFIIALPMMQLFLFGYAINTDPKHLPAGLLSVNHSKYERSLIAALQNTGYYDISMLSSEAEAERALAQGELLFVITIPANFDRSVDRGDAPSIRPPSLTRPPRCRPYRRPSTGTCRRSARCSRLRCHSRSWFTPATTRSG
jgi:ABC-2 type transport system permease protein